MLFNPTDLRLLVFCRRTQEPARAAERMHLPLQAASNAWRNESHRFGARRTRPKTQVVLTRLYEYCASHR
jgi:hypothetical protein